MSFREAESAKCYKISHGIRKDLKMIHGMPRYYIVILLSELDNRVIRSEVSDFSVVYA
jgi:hypothetical protein